MKHLVNQMNCSPTPAVIVDGYLVIDGNGGVHRVAMPPLHMSVGQSFTIKVGRNGVQSWVTQKDKAKAATIRQNSP